MGFASIFVVTVTFFVYTSTMSLNWKEINLILEELGLEGMQIQKAVQSAFDVLSLKLYGKIGAKNLIISISPGSCRIHETFFETPKSEKPLRFAEFLNSRIVNCRIEEAVQLGSDRIVRLTVRRGPEGIRFRLYIRLWSNAANVIVTDMDGMVLDAMRRLPKKKEITGGFYAPKGDCHPLQFSIREFPEDLLAELPAGASFNQKIDALYQREGGGLSLETLKEEARRKFEGSIDRLAASLERLREKEADFAGAGRFREYGDLILSNLSFVKSGDEWLEAEGFRIKLDPLKSPSASAEGYYEQYRKAKSGLEEIRSQIEEGEVERSRLEETLRQLLSETNPLVLNKLLKAQVKASPKALPGADGALAGGTARSRREDAKRPGLSFRRKDWLIIVGRDAAENDALLRKYVKGNDLWLHARDYPGSYVFIKQRPGKTVPLDILLDAGNLAIFYSKGRNNGEGDLFYTPVKYLRRARGGPRGRAPLGLVIPTQEKNIHVKVETKRLKELESCKVEK